MATLDTLIAHLKSIRETVGTDIPLYLVDNDDVETSLASEFKDHLAIGVPFDGITYKKRKNCPVGLLLTVGN